MSDNKNVVWMLEEDEILIDFVKNHDALYNIKCKDYRKTQMKLNLWREMANILENKTGKRWAYVRDYYVRRKEKPGTRAPGDAAKKRAEQLSFLDGYSSIKRSTITNMGNLEQNTEEVDAVEEDFNSSLENYAQKKLDHQGNKPLLTTEVNNSDNDNTGHHVKLKKLKRLIKHTENSEERLTLLKKIAEKRNNEHQDETDLFFASMAKIVKKLPEKEQVFVRLQVESVIGNAQLRYLQQQECNDIRRSNSSCSNASTNFNSQNEASSSTLSSTNQPAFSHYSRAVPLVSPNDSEDFSNFYNL